MAKHIKYDKTCFNIMSVYINYFFISNTITTSLLILRMHLQSAKL